MTRCTSVAMLLTITGFVAAQSPVDFEKQIWPILERRCIACHGAPTRTAGGRLKDPKGGVRLDSREGIRSSLNGEVIVAGEPDHSLLYERITLPEGNDDIMPPPESGMPLTSAQTGLIKRWIKQGADYGGWKGNQPEDDRTTVRGGPKRLAVMPPITSLAFAPDGQSLVACSQSGVHIYDWPALRRRMTIEATALNLHDVAFSPSGDRLAVSGGDPSQNGVVEVFAWPSLQSLGAIEGHEDSVLASAWRDRASFASASLDRSIHLWNIRFESSMGQFNGHSRGVTALCFLEDNKTLVSAGIDESLRVWNLESGELVRSLNQHTGPVHALALRPAQSRLPIVASAAGDRTIRFWQPTIGRMIRYARLEAEPLDIAWTNDGSSVAAACADGHLRIVNADTVTVTLDSPAIDGWAYSVAVHPTDGSIVLGGSKGEVRWVNPSRDAR